VDPRSDLYALGAVGYFLLTGDHVFAGASVVEVCSAHLHTAPPPLAERGVGDCPPALEALILCCLAKAPAKRPQSAQALQRDLAQCGVQPWTEDDARRWWADRGATLGARRRRVPTVTGLVGKTIDVDIAARNGLAQTVPATLAKKDVVPAG